MTQIHIFCPHLVAEHLKLQALAAKCSPIAGPGEAVTYITRPMWKVWCLVKTTRRFRRNNSQIKEVGPEDEGAVGHTRTIIIESDALASMSRMIPAADYL